MYAGDKINERTDREPKSHIQAAPVLIEPQFLQGNALADQQDVRLEVRDPADQSVLLGGAQISTRVADDPEVRQALG